MESDLKAQDRSRIGNQAKSSGISPALLAALESSKPSHFLPQKIVAPLSETWQTIHKLLSNLVDPHSFPSAWKAREHGVPTGLFRLPLEIREQIYGLVAGHRTILKIPEYYYKPRQSGGDSNNGLLSLFQTCRQL